MIIWESRAEQELQEIYDHIYLNSHQNADLVVDELGDFVQKRSNGFLPQPIILGFVEAEEGQHRGVGDIGQDSPAVVLICEELG